MHALQLHASGMNILGYFRFLQLFGKISYSKRYPNMAREGMAALPSRQWSCETLLNGIQTAAQLAGIQLEPGRSLDEKQAGPCKCKAQGSTL